MLLGPFLNHALAILLLGGARGWGPASSLQAFTCAFNLAINKRMKG